MKKKLRTTEKPPGGVYKRLIECAINLCAEKGLAGVTVDAVSSAAKVTKGGLFHYFPNKQALLEGVFITLVEQLDHKIDDFIRKDDQLYGRFTRAYLEFAFAANDRDRRIWLALAGVLPCEDFSEFWNSWMEKRLAQHADTDNSCELEIVRLAAEGVWAVLATNTAKSFNMQNVYKKLLAMTKQPV